MPSQRALVFWLGVLVALVVVAYATNRSPVFGLVGVVVLAALLILKQRSQ